MDSLDDVNRKRKKKILRQMFLACAIGTSSCISATFSLTGLQSSLNVRESLGTVSMAVRSATGILGNLLVSPFIVKRYGAKIGLIIAELTDILFTIVNFRPRWYTMISANAISGLGSSIIWVASGTIIQSIASRSAEGKEVSIEVQRYFGIFFGIMATGQMISNGVTQIILKYAFAAPNNTDVSRHLLHVYNSSVQRNETLDYDITDLASCGSHDCPAEYVFLSETPKFQTFSPDQNAVYLLLSIYLMMQFAAILIHLFLLPIIPPIEVKENISDEENSTSPKTPLLSTKKTSAWSDLLHNARAVFAYLISVQGLLISPVHLLYGLAISFVWSEFNRAFVSCVIGVEQVGICSLIVDLLYFSTSTVISRVAPRFGLVSIMVVGMVYDVTNYTVSSLWVPNESTLFLPYVFSATYGISHGIRRNTTYLIVCRYSQDKAIGFSAQGVVFCLGAVITFAWSTPLCVYMKMYAMIALVLFSTTSWGVAEYMIRRHTVPGVPDAK